MKHALVFGGSGQIGSAVIARLLGDGWQVHAVSRQPRCDRPGLRWLQGGFAEDPAMPASCDAIVSCGPLDLFSTWYAAARTEHARAVAFGSTSVDTKRDAEDPGERALARRLRDAEQRVFAAARERGATASVLRPTLVYGNGLDASLSRIAALARRSGFFVLPRGASGRRQPVHVDDLASAACTIAERGCGAGHAYAMPGGETLSYRDMIARTLAALPTGPRLVEVPAPLFRIALAAGRATGRLRALPAGAVARMREDMVFDDAPARRDLGYDPRPFRPTAGMFERVSPSGQPPC